MWKPNIKVMNTTMPMQKKKKISTLDLDILSMSGISHDV